MSVPADYPSSTVASLWGGVRDDICNSVVGPDTMALTSSQAAAETDEMGRRKAAEATAGLGVLLALEEVGYSCGIGISDVAGLEVAGEGLPEVAPVSPAVHKSYGPDRPVYAAGEVGGVDFVGGRQEAPVKVGLGFRRSAGSAVTVVSVPSRPSLLSRLAGRFRRR